MPSSTKDPEILREEIKGNFAFSQNGDSQWNEVLFKVGDDASFVEDGEDVEDDEFEGLAAGEGVGGQLNGADEVGFPLDLGRVLFRIDRDADQLAFEPLTRTGRNEFRHRYPRVRVIVLEGFGFDVPQTDDDVIWMLAHWPKGFTQNPDFGLGLLKEYRHIVHAIEEVSGVDTLIITKKRATAINGKQFLLSYKDFESTRRGIDTCHRNALAQAAADKADIAYNGLLTQLDPTRYPERIRPRTEGTVLKVLQSGVKVGVSDKSQLAAVKLVTHHSKNLAAKHPDTLMKLRRDIELVTLEEVIGKMHTLIQGETSEARWQGLFRDHPFILGLAFSIPIVLFQEQASVGGGTFEGKGEKIADFLYRNDLTDNLTIVEIKAASMTLLGPQYRGGVFPPSRELSGVIAQVLDQKHKLEEEFLVKRARTSYSNIQRYALRCIVIAGKAPDEPDSIRSFELFRATLHDVLVVTFDEVLAKLKHLHEFLVEKQPASTSGAGAG